MSFLTGYVEFSGLGGFQEKFVSELFENKIRCRKLRYEAGYIHARISPVYYLYASRLARKHGFRIRVTRKKGAYFKLFKFRKRYGLAIGGMIFFLLLIWSSNYIWDVDVVGNERVPTDRIRTVMHDLGIKSGIERGSANYTEIERRALLEIPEIAWVNINASGSKLTIEVSELAKRLEEGDGIELSSPCNVVSTKDAVILSSEVLEGKQIVENGSGVRRGGIIVSGVFSDNEGNMYYKHAKANIVGQFFEEREFFIPYNDKTFILGEKQTTKNYLMFMNNNIPLFIFDAKVKSFHYDEQVNEMKFFGVNLPFKHKKGIYTEYEEVEIIRTDDDIKKILDQQRLDFEENFYSDYEIIEAEKTFIPEDDGIKLQVTYTLRGNIAKSEEIFLIY